MKNCHLIMLLAMGGLTASVLQVTPVSEVVTQGNGDSTPVFFTALSCAVRPPQFTVTWFHAGQGPLTSMGKYNVLTNTSVYNESVYGSALVIQKLSYSDMGNYTCVVRPSPPNGSESYSATVQLILLVKVEVLGPTNITVNVTVTSEVELSCEMSQYIHPDGDLWWFKGEQRIDVTQYKYSIVYWNGTKLAQNGGSSVTSSRVSVLRISQLTSSDSGVYTCKLYGTDLSGEVSVSVMGYVVPTSTMTNLQTTITPSLNPLLTPSVLAPSSTSFLPPLIGTVAGVLGLLVIILIAILLIAALRSSKSRNPQPTSKDQEALQLDSGGPTYAVVSPSTSPALPTRCSHPSGRNDQYSGSEMNDKELLKDQSYIPTPANVLGGSAIAQSIPQYESNFFLRTDPDYDQIYSEALDPAMLTHDYDVASDNDVAIPYSAIYEEPKEPLTYNSSVVKVTRKNIIEIRNLGTGQFGQVILARTVGVRLMGLQQNEGDYDTNGGVLVAIKKLKPDAENGLVEAFDKEVKFMSRLRHDNVVKLLGVCTEGESFIMMEYMENGDLNQFLQKQKVMPDTISGLKENEITPIILLYMGVQIASGMHYLSSRRFVHRDLATRNCLVGRDFVVKISDFGMSRSLYESAYYRVQGTLILPIRWMATETFYGKFSVKSDSWAFGVTMWEIYTLGKLDPYEEMTDEEVIADAIRGADRKRLTRPECCPQKVYDVMLRCWAHDPLMRADFTEIYSRLFITYTQYGASLH